MPKEIQTKRLKLRPLKDTDYIDLFEIYNSDFVQKYNIMKKMELEELKDYFNESKDQEIWYIEVLETGKAIGQIHLSYDSIRYNTGTKNLSYWLGEQHARKGYMREALSAVIEHLFLEKGLSGITARVFSENEASLYFVGSLGFEREGFLKNAVKNFDGKIFDDVLFYLENKKEVVCKI